MIKIVKIVIIKAFKSKFYQYFVFTKKILQRFVSFCISLIFTYCLFVEKKLVTIKHFLLNFLKMFKCLFVTNFFSMATNLPSCFSIQFLEQFLKFLVNFTLLKYVKSQRSYGFLITKELIFGFQILDLKDHFSASLSDVKF